MGPDEILRRYIPKDERQSILVEAHGGVTSGNYVRKATTQKILRVGLWWSIVYKDEKEFYRACDICERT